MKQNPFFSVQMAAYNAEKYLRESVESVLAQTERDFEILLVDDCSKDGTSRICDEYAKRYPDRVFSFHNKENKGLLLSRRVAYRAARGEWIISVDADDILLPEALETIKKAIMDKPCDLLLYNMTCCQLNGRKDEIALPLRDGVVYTGDEKKEVYLLRYQNDNLNSMCTKAVSRSLLDLDVDYTPFQGLYKGTDIFQAYPILDRAQRILYLNQSLYLYNKRKNSLTTGTNSRWYDAKKILWKRDDEYLEKWEVESRFAHAMLYSRLREVIVYLDRLYANGSDRAFKKRIFSCMTKDSLVRQWYKTIRRDVVKTRHRLYAVLICRGWFPPFDCFVKAEMLLSRRKATGQ